MAESVGNRPISNGKRPSQKLAWKYMAEVELKCTDMTETAAKSTK